VIPGKTVISPIQVATIHRVSVVKSTESSVVQVLFTGENVPAATAQSGKRWVAMTGLALLFGCGGSADYPGPMRYAIAGKVTCNGVPVDVGTISFRPTDDRAGRLAGGPVVNGEYSVEESKGPTAGTYRVEILWHKATGKKYPDPTGNGEMHDVRVQVLPPRYHRDTETSIEIGGEKATFDFDLEVPEAEIERAIKSEARMNRPGGER
jgi:hypothetical protein